MPRQPQLLRRAAYMKVGPLGTAEDTRDAALDSARVPCLRAAFSRLNDAMGMTPYSALPLKLS